MTAKDLQENSPSLTPHRPAPPRSASRAAIVHWSATLDSSVAPQPTHDSDTRVRLSSGFLALYVSTHSPMADLSGAAASMPPPSFPSAMTSPEASCASSISDMALASPVMTGSTGAAPVTSPSMSKLPGLQYAIGHRRATDLRLPSFARSYEGGSDLIGMNSNDLAANGSGLQLSMQQCETPHFFPGVLPFCPDSSPTDKHRTLAASANSMDTDLDGADSDDNAGGSALGGGHKRRKKGTRRGTLNPEAKNVLKAWMFSPEHFAHPYPSEEEKEELASEAGIEVKQLSNWFTNARKRLWQPVLRQSGVEVKNFLSTGRGGPRGNKLDVPPNLQYLVSQNATPPSSPARSEESNAPLSVAGSPLKRVWAEIQPPSCYGSPSDHASMTAEELPKRKKLMAATRKRAKANENHLKVAANAASMTHVASQLSHELRLALAEQASAMNAGSSLTSFQELEILAATSLIGLHQQYQSVH